MSLIHVEGFGYPSGWNSASDAESRARGYCEQLEAGGILYFPAFPFDLPASDRTSLLAKKQTGLRYHKNMSFRPRTGEVRGFTPTSPEEGAELRRIMANFSGQAVSFVNRFLSPYAGRYSLDYASYRPIEEAGRDLSFHKRNDLLHVDAFPSRPTAGNRILRVFANINPTRARSWVVGEGFDSLAARYAEIAGLETIIRQNKSLTRKAWRGAGSVIRLLTRNSPRTAYDAFMLHFHDWLKENADYQANGQKTAIDFPPGSAWIVYTDYVPHAVMTGQFALEQTFIIHRDGMVAPERAPIRILERLSSRKLAA
jgi:hypothetical protein